MKTNNEAGSESVRRARHGDAEEFARLAGLHAPRMLSLAVGIVRRRDVAEDVVQDALVKACERIAQWRGESSLSTWLYRITYTTALDALRRSERRPFEQADALAAEGAAGGSEEEGDWQTTEDNIARMRRALDELPPLDRTMVALFYLDERSVRDVAAICGRSEANVKTRLHRARRRLHELMKGTK
jgi:RNA polymerase sigma-70 factor (ECF subfamily)